MFCVAYTKNVRHMSRSSDCGLNVFFVFVKVNVQQARVTSHVLFEQQIATVKSTAKNLRVRE